MLMWFSFAHLYKLSSMLLVNDGILKEIKNKILKVIKKMWGNLKIYIFNLFLSGITCLRSKRLYAQHHLAQRKQLALWVLTRKKAYVQNLKIVSK